MPGLIRGMARTAAVVGTASAVRGRVARRQQERWRNEDQAEAYRQYQYARPAAPPAPAPQAAPAPSPAPASEPDPISQLERLGALRDKGVLTEEEFAAQKAKILGG